MIERTTDFEKLGNLFGLKIKPVDVDTVEYDKSARHVYDFNEKRILISSNVPCKAWIDDEWVESEHSERVIIPKSNISAVVLADHPIFHVPCVTIYGANLAYETLFDNDRDALEFHHILDQWL